MIRFERKGRITAKSRSGRSRNSKNDDDDGSCSRASMYSRGGDTTSLVMSSMNTTSTDPWERLNQTVSQLESHTRKQKQKQKQQQLTQHSPRRLSRDDDEIVFVREEELDADNNSQAVVNVDVDDNFDKKVVRMDGLEVYAVVRALTEATSLSTFDNFSGDWDANYGTGDWLEIVLSYIFLIFASIGTISGLHTVSVFSLVTMYGRTAIGISDNNEYEVFLDACLSQRFVPFSTIKR